MSLEFPKLEIAKSEDSIDIKLEFGAYRSEIYLAIVQLLVAVVGLVLVSASLNFGIIQWTFIAMITAVTAPLVVCCLFPKPPLTILLTTHTIEVNSGKLPIHILLKHSQTRSHHKSGRAIVEFYREMFRRPATWAAPRIQLNIDSDSPDRISFNSGTFKIDQPIADEHKTKILAEIETWIV